MGMATPQRGVARPAASKDVELKSGLSPPAKSQALSDSPEDENLRSARLQAATAATAAAADPANPQLQQEAQTAAARVTEAEAAAAMGA